MTTILRQPNSVARVSHFVAIETRSRNKIDIRGNIQTDIAIAVSLCDSTNIVAKNQPPIATKHILVVIEHIFCLDFTALQ
jgi:hypothetical protein